MCGIVGVITAANNGFSQKQENAFYELLQVDVLRGEDSTGVVFIENDGSYGVMKEATPAYYCMDNMKHEYQFGKSMFNWGKAMIGHNRKATVGKIKDDTAHPFVIDNTFAMVHNGTLYNHRQLAQTEVDSEALAKHLQPHLGPDFQLETFEEAVGKVEGAFAIAAYNQVNEGVYLMRNNQRPLSLAITKDDGVFFASELGMLYWILGRNDINLKDVQISPLKENTLFHYDLRKNEYSFTEYTPKKPQPVIYTKMTGSTGGSGEKTSTVDQKTSQTQCGDADELTKNGFKRLQRRLALTFLSFFVDDYCEDNFPKTVEEGETQVTLLGEDPHLEVSHLIQAKVDLKDFAKEEVEGGWLDRYYTGRIYNMTYNKVTKQVTLHVDTVQMVPRSVPAKLPAIVDAKYIQAKLEEKEKNEASPTVH